MSRISEGLYLRVNRHIAEAHNQTDFNTYFGVKNFCDEEADIDVEATNMEDQAGGPERVPKYTYEPDGKGGHYLIPYSERGILPSSSFLPEDDDQDGDYQVLDPDGGCDYSIAATIDYDLGPKPLYLVASLCASDRVEKDREARERDYASESDRGAEGRIACEVDDDDDIMIVYSDIKAKAVSVNNTPTVVYLNRSRDDVGSAAVTSTAADSSKRKKPRESSSVDNDDHPSPKFTFTSTSHPQHSIQGSPRQGGDLPQQLDVSTHQYIQPQQQGGASSVLLPAIEARYSSSPTLQRKSPRHIAHPVGFYKRLLM